MRNSRIAPLSNFAAKNVERFTLPLVPSDQKSIQRSSSSPRRKLKSHSFWTVKWVTRFIRANQKPSRWLPLIALDFRSEGTRRSVSLSTFLLRSLKAERFDFLLGREFDCKYLNKIPTLCPASSPAGITLIGALYCKSKTWLWTRANFELRLFNGKTLQLLLLKFRRKSSQCVGEMCIFDNPLFYTEFVAYFDKKIQTEF